MDFYSRSVMNNTINEFVINPHHRSILQMRYCDGMTYEKIAENANYSTQHIKRICYAYKDLLMNQL